jgi:hypothetical protein
MSEFPTLSMLVADHFKICGGHYQIINDFKDVIICQCRGIGSVGYISNDGAFAWHCGDIIHASDPEFLTKLMNNLAICHDIITTRYERNKQTRCT